MSSVAVLWTCRLCTKLIESLITCERLVWLRDKCPVSLPLLLLFRIMKFPKKFKCRWRWGEAPLLLLAESLFHGLPVSSAHMASLRFLKDLHSPSVSFQNAQIIDTVPSRNIQKDQWYNLLTPGNHCAHWHSCLWNRPFPQQWQARDKLAVLQALSYEWRFFLPDTWKVAILVTYYIHLVDEVILVSFFRRILINSTSARFYILTLDDAISIFVIIVHIL